MKPKIFIGSSAEGKPIADAIQVNFSYEAYPTVWTQMVLPPASYPLDGLLTAIAEHDFGILVATPDDVAKIRGATVIVPRGNVIFEAALVMGKHGRDRCFLVQSRGNPLFTVPTDLVGVIPATYDEVHAGRNAVAALGPACTEIRHAMTISASFNRAVKVIPRLELDDPTTSSLTYPKKVAFAVTNPTSSPVLLTSREFEMGALLKGHPSRSTGPKQFKADFYAYTRFVEINKPGVDVHLPDILLKPGTSARAWVALDNATDDAVAADALAKSEVGIWRLTCHWLAEPMELREYDFPV